MPPDTHPPPFKYAARLQGVREVTLLGDADLDYWRGRLRSEALSPVEQGGRAAMLLSAVDSRYMGIRFREMIVCVFVRRESTPSQDGAYLAYAFNSSRCFACMERTFFATPYYPAGIEVRASPPASMAMGQGTRTLLRAAMADEPREPREFVEDVLWPIYLPKHTRTPNAPGKFFYAKIGGRTLAYPYAAGDTLTIEPDADCPVLGWLKDCQFTGREWVLRESADHGKSKTYSRRRLEQPA